MTNKKHGIPPFVDELAEYLSKKFVDCGVDSAEAKDRGLKSALDFAQNWGGHVIYIPKNLSQNFEDKHDKIVSEFNGSNHSELAAKYDVHVRTIYKILKRKFPDDF